MKGKEAPEYHYHDYGSLVSLGKYSTVGNMMGNLSKGSLMRLIDRVDAELRSLAEFNDPRNLYYHCFCELL